MAPDTLQTVLEIGHLDDFTPLRSVSNDMSEMHHQFGVHEAVKNLSQEQLKKFLEFRFDFLQEEINEGRKAIAEANPEEIVDALIDLTVVAVGTLDLFWVDFDKAWLEVLRANTSKEVGVNANRPNELGLPDLIKPEGWTAPSHEGNHGIIAHAFA